MSNFLKEPAIFRRSAHNRECLAKVGKNLFRGFEPDRMAYEAIQDAQPAPKIRV